MGCRPLADICLHACYNCCLKLCKTVRARAFARDICQRQFALVIIRAFDLTSSQPCTLSLSMSDSSTPNQKDRSLQKALTNKIVDEYFDHSESWLRAILRMCIFSMIPTYGQTALLIECPNQAVAKRLSRKTWPLQEAAECLAGYRSDRQVLICYQEGNQGAWRCFDTKTNTWKNWDNPQTPTAPTDS